MAGNGVKHPLLVLLPHGEKVSGLDVNGHVLEAEQIDLMSPREINRMQAMLKEMAPEG